MIKLLNLYGASAIWIALLYEVQNYIITHEFDIVFSVQNCPEAVNIFSKNELTHSVSLKKLTMK